MERGWGVNILEDARHCSVLYISKYFVVCNVRGEGVFSVRGGVRGYSGMAKLGGEEGRERW